MSEHFTQQEIDDGWRKFVQHLDPASQERVIRVLQSENLDRGLLLIEGLATGYKAAGVIGNAVAAVLNFLRRGLLYIVSMGLVYVAIKAWLNDEITLQEAFRWLTK